MRSWSRSLAIIAASLLASSLAAQGVDYTDYRHHTVHFPLGDRSFADEVVSYAMGHPEPQPAYVRLTDLKEDCGGRWPGADIDAIGAIGSALHISLNAAVLFDFNESTLKPSAKQALHDAANSIRSVRGASVRIDGHTDNVGTDAVNRKLSLARANAVRDYLQKVEGLKGTMETAGLAATKPVDTNATA